jgi:hypothetical protein
MPSLPDTYNREAEVVARVEVPLAVRTLVVRELVKVPSVARRSAVKKEPVEVALVKDAASEDKRPLTERDEILVVASTV